jgi:hypothetical protein
VRWVELPLEDHSYRSQEAVGHVLWEMLHWCDRFMKKRPRALSRWVGVQSRRYPFIERRWAIAQLGLM